jgi:hypothetical protein
VEPNPLAPFPKREGGKFKASPLVGERFGERFSRSRKKSDKHSKSSLLSLLLALSTPIAVNLKTYLLHTRTYAEIATSLDLLNRQVRQVRQVRHRR